MIKFGLPYKGSKNKIVDEIVSIFPNADNFYDLFAGGGAVTHCAFLSGKFKNIYYNDYDKLVVEYFSKAINGEYENRNEWIDRKTFYDKKDSDPFIKYVWSFSNGGKTYLYGENIEDFKRAIYEAIVFDEFDEASKFGLDLSFLKSINKEQKQNVSKQTFKGCKSVCNKKDIDKFRQQALERIKRISQVFNSISKSTALINPKPSLNISSCSYDKVDIKPNSIIYCDIPYRDTDSYTVSESFDYNKFYDWCLQQKQPLFISEYFMPNDFVCVKEINRISCANGKHKESVVEKIFRPKGQL